ncbi:TlyA family RNA methyltransferase [Bacillota bacterium LX-D]|nr:TlyA family RNA methyltransferase [Bacillota bacterium LX-D]
MKKERLDILLVQSGFYSSREKAKAAIMAGLILVNGEKIDKPGTLVPVDSTLKKTGNDLPFVSRGGLKLQKALQVFPINLNDKIILDVGSSTGGFTHCALLNGAAKVFAVDVGYGQLAWQLRQDPRVISLERTNVRFLSPDNLGMKADISTIDVSFISLSKVFPTVKNCLKENGQIIALIKPQFEAGKEKVGKKGVVKDPTVHQEVILNVIREAQAQSMYVAGLTFSPITGSEGNIEYLIWLKCEGLDHIDLKKLVVDTVIEAHTKHRKKIADNE